MNEYGWIAEVVTADDVYTKSVQMRELQKRVVAYAEMKSPPVAETDKFLQDLKNKYNTISSRFSLSDPARESVAQLIEVMGKNKDKQPTA